MIDKKRLLRQFALPTDQKQAFTATWRRQQDLFGDSFELTAQVGLEEIKLTYTHTEPHKAPQTIWGLVISTSLAGRGRIDQSVGIHPSVTSLHRAAAIVSCAILQMQTNPKISTSHSIYKKPLKNARALN